MFPIKPPVLARKIGERHILEPARKLRHSLIDSLLLLTLHLGSLRLDPAPLLGVRQ
jgi:hypothetical protein